jgi:hypothetical protein
MLLEKFCGGPETLQKRFCERKILAYQGEECQREIP